MAIRITSAQALIEIRELVANEAYAMTALSLGAYRRDLLKTINDYITETNHTNDDNHGTSAR